LKEREHNRVAWTRRLASGAISICLLLAPVGCDRWSEYHYSGVIRSKTNCTPVEGARVTLLAVALPQESDQKLQQELASSAQTTDAAGHFAGMFVGNFTRFFFPPPAPPLQQVYSHVHSAGGWQSLEISLSPNSQARTAPGERYINLPTVYLADDGTPSLKNDPK
jgi:hypothetical protein